MENAETGISMMNEEVVAIALKEFGLSAGNVTPEKVVARFLKGNIRDREKIQSKKYVLINLMEKDDLDKFELPVKNCCPACKGKGFIAKYENVIEKKQCPDCIDETTGKSTGSKISPCRNCGGTGLIFTNDENKVIKIKPGEKILVLNKETRESIVLDSENEIIHHGKTHECSTCRGRGTYIYMKVMKKDKPDEVLHQGKKCLTCRGEAEIKVSRKVLKETKDCDKCGGSGIYISVGTAVLSNDLGSRLMSIARPN